MFRSYRFWYYVLISIAMAINALLVLLAHWLYVR